MRHYAKHILVFLVVCFLNCKISTILFPEIDQGDSNWELKQSQHFYIYFRPNSEASLNIEYLATRLDREFLDCCEILKVKYDNKIKCYIYSSLQELRERQQTRGSGLASPEFETICYHHPTKYWDGFRHEITHVVVYWTVGVTRLRALSEGIAEAIERHHQMTGEGKLRVHITVCGLLEKDLLFSISQLASNEFFKNTMDSQLKKQYPTYHLYEQCGSLVCYLVDQYSIDKFKTFYAKASEDNYRSIFQCTYDKSIDDFEKEWHDFLCNY